jgi:hypothetical protein
VRLLYGVVGAWISRDARINSQTSERVREAGGSLGGRPAICLLAAGVALQPRAARAAGPVCFSSLGLSWPLPNPGC